MEYVFLNRDSDFEYLWIFKLIQVRDIFVSNHLILVMAETKKENCFTIFYCSI